LLRDELRAKGSEEVDAALPPLVASR